MPHSSGVIHRDIKPANILFDKQGNAFLADFGVAHLTDLTTKVSFAGTPRYMAPEQILGKRLTGRTDVYQLGELLYEMVTGKPPYPGPTRNAFLAQHVTASIPKAHLINRAIPQPSSMVLTKALSKEPRHRHSTPRTLTTEFQRSFGILYTLPPWSMPLIAGLILVFVFALIVIPSPTPDPIPSTPTRTPSLSAIEANLNPRTDQIAFIGKTNWLSVYNLDGSLETVFHHDHLITTLDWLPSTSNIIFGDTLGNVRLISNPRSANAKQITTHTADVTAAVFSPAGDIVVTGDDNGTVRISSLSSMVSKDLALGHGDAINAIAWHPNGTFFATADEGNRLTIWNATTQSVVQSTSVDSGSLNDNELFALAWQTDGDILVAGTEKGNIYIWNTMATNQALRQQIPRQEPIWTIKPAPQSQQFLMTTDSAVYLWSQHDSSPLQLATAITSFVGCDWLTATSIVCGEETGEIREIAVKNQ